MNDDLAEMVRGRVDEMIDDDPESIVMGSVDPRGGLKTAVTNDPEAATVAVGALIHEIAKKSGASIVEVSEEATKVAFDVRQSDDFERTERNFDNDE